MLTVRKFQTLNDVNIFLQGGIRASRALSLRPGQGSALKLFGLDGLTLVFNSPAAAGTVTFSDPSDEGLDLKAVADQILTQTTANGAAVRAKFSRDGASTQLTLIEPTPASGVTIDSTSTAAATFGFDDEDVVGTFYNPPDGAAPRLIETGTSPQGESFVVVTEET